MPKLNTPREQASKYVAPARPARSAAVSYVPTEPAWKDDAGKVDLSLLPFAALEDVARVLEHGARKYSPDAWRRVPNGHARYVNAALRHLHAHARGEVVDAESGLPHLAHAACSLLFAMELPR
jgi:hypothetical protein